MRRQYVDRVGRKRQIFETFQALNRSLTTHEIARFIHLEPSTYLRKILKEMETEGVLSAWDVQHRPNAVKRLYVLSDQYSKPLQQQVLI